MEVLIFMDVNERIFDLLDKQGKTAVELGKYIDVAPSSINGWKKGSYPSSKYIIRISEFLGVSINYLFTGKNDITESTLSSYERELIDNFRLLQQKEKYKVLGRIETYLEEYDYNSINNDSDFEIMEAAEQSAIYGSQTKDNIINLDKHRALQFETDLWGEVSAGSGIDAIPDRETIKVPFKCDFALRIIGNSMEPLYYDQQIIYLKQQPDIEQGQIAAVQIEDYIPTAFLKKVYKENSHIRLVSLNPIYEDKIYPASQVRILGTVINNNDIFF